MPVNNLALKPEIGTTNKAIQGVENEKTQPGAENAAAEQRVSSDGSNDEPEDGNYVKSTSPSSSSSTDSDENDVFVPPKRTPVKGKNKAATAAEKSAKKPSPEEKPKLKSKLIQNADSKKASIKLRIEKKVDKSPELKTKKNDRTAAEEKLKEKRKLKEEKEKMAKFSREREKKLGKEKRPPPAEAKNAKDKLQDDRLKGELSKLIPKSIDKLGRIPKKPKESDSVGEEKPTQPRKDDGKEKPKVEEKKSVKKEEKPTTPKPNEKEAKKEKDSKKPVPTPPKKPVSMSVEKRFAAEAKPKTVKAYNSKFRLTGLEQESIPKPPPRKSSSTSSHASASSSKDRGGVKRSPTKDGEIEPAEKRLKSPDVSTPEDKNSPVATKVVKRKFLKGVKDWVFAAVVLVAGSYNVPYQGVIPPSSFVNSLRYRPKCRELFLNFPSIFQISVCI